MHFKLKILSLLFCSSSLFANMNETCNLENDYMLSILMNEHHPKKPIGYEYIISFNEKKDAEIIKQYLAKDWFIDNRSIDCRAQGYCIQIIEALEKLNIKNVDLGPFQLNFKYQKVPSYSDYFDFSRSYLKACSYATQMLKERGHDWRGLAAYHSKTETFNEIYRNKLIKNYLTIQEIRKKQNIN